MNEDLMAYLKRVDATQPPEREIAADRSGKLMKKDGR